MRYELEVVGKSTAAMFKRMGMRSFVGALAWGVSDGLLLTMKLSMRSPLTADVSSAVPLLDSGEQIVQSVARGMMKGSLHMSYRT